MVRTSTATTTESAANELGSRTVRVIRIIVDWLLGCRPAQVQRRAERQWYRRD